MKRKYNPTPRDIQLLIETYDGTPEKTDWLCKMYGGRFPRWYVKRLAAIHGLTRLPGPGPEWTEEELDILTNYYHRLSIDVLARKLKAASGISRSRTAIVLKKKRLGITKTGDGYTLRGLMEMLGMQSHHTINDWVRHGYLKGTRRNTDRENDMWLFAPDAIREFLINHAERLDKRKVDLPWIIDICTGRL